MPRRCKCQVTGEQGTTDVFYQADNGKYYKTKELYEEQVRQKKALRKAKKVLYEDFFGYLPGQPFSTWGVSELSQLTRFYDATTVLRTIEENYDAIRRSIKSKNFKNERAMVRYVFAIIRNNIKDVREKEQRQKERERPVAGIEIIEDAPEEENEKDLHAGSAKNLTDVLRGGS